jgi:hypothetical protein
MPFVNTFIVADLLFLSILKDLSVWYPTLSTLLYYRFYIVKYKNEWILVFDWLRFI